MPHLSKMHNNPKNPREYPFFKDSFNNENVVLTNFQKEYGDRAVWVATVNGKKYQISEKIAQLDRLRTLERMFKDSSEPIKIFFYKGANGRMMFETARENEVK